MSGSLQSAGGPTTRPPGGAAVRAVLALLAALVLVAGSTVPAAAARGAVAASPPTGQVAAEAWGALPLAFVENRGQTAAEVRYHAEAGDAAFFFTPDRVVVALTEPDGARLALALRFVGADPDVQPRGEDPVGGRVRYLRGDDPSRWSTGLPRFATIVYPDLWPGIDMVLGDGGGTLKYEFRVRPGADPRDIRLDYDGADALAVDASGALRIGTPLGAIRDAAPVSYQVVGGSRVHVESRYLLAGGGTGYGFEVGAYRADRELVIDPALEYSTFLGGAAMERAEAMAVAGDGSLVVVGVTQSTDFPTTTGAVSRTFTGGIMDAFVARLTPDGSGLVYATYLGGTPTATRRGNVDHTELARSVAVDAAGNAYVTGQTSSGDFPTTSGAFDRSLGVGEQTATDGFVAKLGPTGALAYSTFLGSDLGSDDGRAIAVDGAGNAYVAGSTFSADFPTTSGAFDGTHAGGEDVFVAKVDASGSSLLYSTLLGGTDNELSHGIAVDGAGNAYVSGSTRSVGFPSTAGSFQPAHSGGEFAELFEAFVTQVDPTGSSLVYSTFLGGTEIDHGGEIAVDPDGHAYVLVGTQSPTFPTTAGAYDTVFDGTSEGAVVKLDAGGARLVYSTFFRGASAIALDSDLNAWLGGTAAPGAPTTADAFQSTSNGGNDGYIAQLDATGSRLLYGTLIGGANSDNVTGIGLDATEDVYVAGTTQSADFPTTPGALDRTFSGDPSIFWGDAFAAKLTAGSTPPPADTTAPAVGISGPAAGSTVSGTVSVTVSATDDVGVTEVRLFVDGTLVGSDPSSPYAVPWDTTAAANRDHVLTATARDTAGNTGSSAPVTVTVGNAPPAPTTGTTTFSGNVGRNQTVRHTQTVGAGTVELRLGWTESRSDVDLRVRSGAGTVVFSSTGSARPKTGTFTAAAGTYTFEVTNSSRRSTAYTLSVTYPRASTSSTDTAAPTVTVSSPAPGSTVSGTVPVTAAATDDVGVTEVRLFVDGAQIGAADTTSPYSVAWDTTAVADGSRVLTARAVDAAGNATTSAPVTVTVSNQATAPAVSLSSLRLDPTSVTGGDTATGTVTLTAAAPSGGATVTLVSSSTAVATVPTGVTVAAGATSATFTVSTSPQGVDASSSISATHGGTTRSVTLSVAPATATTDTVTITRAEYDDGELEVRAASTDGSATLTVHVTATGERIGTLSSGRGTFDWPTNPQSITVRSSAGGSEAGTVSG